VLFPPQEFNKIKEDLVIYECALKVVKVRIDVLLDEFRNFHINNPIEHIKTRLKTPESIVEKLHRQNLPITAESARKNLTDIVGIRCICSYARDVFFVAKVLKNQPDMKVRSEKDYVTNPKKSGYRSFHLILDVPIYLSNRIEVLPVEVQIRTQAMDFWASLEHKVRYKYKDQMPEHLVLDLMECAEKIAELDDRMFLIQDIVDLAY
jgi:putative GTP pyrophosphokinase